MGWVNFCLFPAALKIDIVEGLKILGIDEILLFILIQYQVQLFLYTEEIN